MKKDPDEESDVVDLKSISRDKLDKMPDNALNASIKRALKTPDSEARSSSLFSNSP